MKFLTITLLFTAVANTGRAQMDANELLAKSDPIIQAQIETAANAFLGQRYEDTRTNVEGAKELKKLKELTDHEKIIEQLAVYAVTETGEAESQQDLKAVLVLNLLDLKPSLVIRVLAPYLDADNEQLRGFAKLWFAPHDNADAPTRSPPFTPVNYEGYFDYVHRQLARGEEIPAGFIKYVYERSQGQALLVFTYASSAPDLVGRLKLMGNVFEARQQGKVPEPQDKTAAQLEDKGKVRLKARREIELAEHIVGNAIWLKENGFDERFQAALPEVNETLATLAKRKEWWVRLHVAYVMRQHPELRLGNVLQQLSTDSNALVNEVAKAAKE